jgi:HK97 family phage prohead protease
MDIERRFNEGLSVEVRAHEGSKKMSGYAAVFYDPENRGTEYGLGEGAVERIMPGAFQRAISEGDDVRALYNHDSNQVLGRTTSGTLRLSVDARGLRYEVDTPDTTLARDLATSIERGDITGSSFAFRVTESEWIREGEKDVREVRGVELFDVGPVTYPAYQATATSVRAQQAADELAEVRQRREDAGQEEKENGHKARIRRLRSIKLREGDA